MQKTILLFTFLFSVLIFNPAFAEISNNSGFIPGQIWYSKDTLVLGETVNIHTAIWNGSNTEMSFKVEFYDKNVILGTRDVKVTAMTLKDVFVPWKITQGDHVISAKIISPTTKISLDRTTTSNDKRFISSGTNTETEEKVTEKINEIIPDKVSTSVSTGFNSVEDIRLSTLDKVEKVKEDAKKEIEQIKKDEQRTSVKVAQGKSIEDSTHKPITYIKLFMFSLFSFILSNKIVFYGLLAIILFYIIRAIYRKVR